VSEDGIDKRLKCALHIPLGIVQLLFQFFQSFCGKPQKTGPFGGELKLRLSLLATKIFRNFKFDGGRVLSEAD
jgi:hypothetical protein